MNEAELPIAFAQVREDALLDMEIVENFAPSQARLMMVASGGCTAAALFASCHLAELHLVDPNPHQLEISRLKLRLLTESLETRLQLLGHAPMEKEVRREALKRFGLTASDTLAERGVDHAGRYEMLFQRLRAHLSLHKGLERAFHEVMPLETLVEFFGEQATQNRLQDFAAHFIQRTRDFIREGNAASPYFQQIFSGRFVEGNYTPWLTMKAPEAEPKVRFTHDFMQPAMKKEHDLDVIHLSNILDWQTEKEATETLALAGNALKKGGVVIIRQLNSTLQIPELNSAFHWLQDDAKRLHKKDRSFIYRNFYIGQKI